jgi:hypothetical protein
MPTQVAYKIEDDQPRKKHSRDQVKDVAVAKNGGPIVPQGKSAPREE